MREYIGNAEVGLGRHFMGACALSSRGNTADFLTGIASSHGYDWVQRELTNSFRIWFNKRKELSSITPSFETQDHDTRLFFTGEAFNLEGLKKEVHWRDSVEACSAGPAQLAIKLYRKHGMDFPSRINGFFCIVVWDARRRSLVIYADRFGSAVPVYYSLQPYGLIFSSQLKLLARNMGKGAEISPTSLAIFLKHSYVPAPRTILRGVFKLAPGEVISYQEGKLKNKRYVKTPSNESAFRNEDEAVEEYLEILNTSILNKARGFSGERIGFFLSGGLDSSANVALASRSGLRGFKAFGIGFEDPKIDERPYARIVANHFGVPFSDYVFDGSEIEDLPAMVWYLDEPFMEHGLFLTYSGFKAAKGGVDLIIAGDGADQLFGTGGFAGGRPIALRFLLERLYLRSILDKGRKHLVSSYFYRDTPLYKAKVMLDRSVDFNDWFFWGFDDNELAKLCRFSINKDSLKCFSNDLWQIPKALSDYYHYSLVHQDFERYACQNVLFKSFRMAEMFQIKLREAYLEKDVIGLVLRTDFTLKTKGSLWDFLKGKRVTKYLHRLSMERVLPREVLDKPKQGGFVPMTALLGNVGVRRRVFDYLSHYNPLYDYLNIAFLKILFQDYEESLKRGAYWQTHQRSKANQIMNILALSLWYEIIGKGQFTRPPKDNLTAFIGG